MATKYPYVASAGPLLRTVDHLRRSFPKDVTAETLRKLGVAPKNESYVINVLRFLGVIDDEGKKVDNKASTFLKQDDAFAREFEELVKESYKELFELHGDGAWNLDRSALKQFFRTADHSTDVVGTRQAGTFVALAGLSGHGPVPSRKEGPAPRKAAQTSQRAKAIGSKEKATNQRSGAAGGTENAHQVGLTVRIEVNLPADGDQQTYDRIFRSIRKNLIDGE